MTSRIRGRLAPRACVAALAIAAIVAQATPAHAVKVGGGAWDAGRRTASCTSGITERTCTYSFDTFDFSEHCQELSTAGQVLAQCNARVFATVTIVPIVAAGGQIVGCMSKLNGEATGGRVAYDSDLNNEFDNTAINQPFEIEVFDLFGDQDQAIVTFEASDRSEGTQPVLVWEAEGEFPATCRRNASSNGSVIATGSVTIETSD